MNRIVLGLIAGAAFISVAHAQSDMNSSSQYRAKYANGALHKSGSACAPDQAKPVTGKNGEMLGYRCVAPSANGQ